MRMCASRAHPLGKTSAPNLPFPGTPDGQGRGCTTRRAAREHPRNTRRPADGLSTASRRPVGGLSPSCLAFRIWRYSLSLLQAVKTAGSGERRPGRRRAGPLPTWARQIPGLPGAMGTGRTAAARSTASARRGYSPGSSISATPRAIVVPVWVVITCFTFTMCLPASSTYFSSTSPI
jgi:hypothetical protein